MPFNIIAEEGPSEEVLAPSENVNSDSISCETLNKLVQIEIKFLAPTENVDSGSINWETLYKLVQIQI